MVASCAPHWGALLVSMHSFQARPGLPVSAWGRESAPLLHVSGTVSGAANGMHIDMRKQVKDINREMIESLQKQVDDGAIELAATTPLESFLGIKFGDDAAKYKDGDEEEESPEDGTIAITAKGRQFLNYKDHIGLLASPFDKKVVAVIATTRDGDYEDCNEYVNETISLLQKKYGVEPIEAHLVIGDGTREVFVFPFYDSEKKRITATIKLVNCDGTLVLCARDEELYRKMYLQKEMSELEAL